ncbi:putative hemin transport protein [Hydrogenophaga palleronii]|uniref:Hemin transport protein n=1 Tax=Hydrogenophaga palleronii TaxID=65655 RepID=A0ABU1WW55_9BURK|nr:ChuX/HutX family heme-like substrate-binding protein [Hydrogenophaga palleronii]MDR7153166.1 putative hemin transport protein [Hydrogenophaga palleronii]
MSTERIPEQFAQARLGGLRAREAAEAIGLSEGAAVAAHVGATDGPLRAHALNIQWLAQLQSLEACGPLLALTRNDSVVHEKTGVYQKLSASGHVGLALGEDIDLRLFFDRWHAGFVVSETPASGGEPRTSLQYFDRHGTAVHKVYPREQTDTTAWQRVLASHQEPQREATFEAKPAISAAGHASAIDVPAFARAWRAMTDTHQFFPLLRQFGLERRQSFQLVQGQFTHRVENASVREMLMEVAFEGTAIMCFVGSPGCIQIHTGPVKRVEPLEMHGKTRLNVLDPGFNLHLREDRIADVWVVEKPTVDGVVTSLEAFDAGGELMAMFFGARKPGQVEQPAWRDLLAHLRVLEQPAQDVQAEAA